MLQSFYIIPIVVAPSTTIPTVKEELLYWRTCVKSVHERLARAQYHKENGETVSEELWVEIHQEISFSEAKVLDLQLQFCRNLQESYKQVLDEGSICRLVNE